MSGLVSNSGSFGRSPRRADLRHDQRIDHFTNVPQACITQNENYTAAYKLLGKALFQSNRLDEAADVLERGLEKALGSGDKQTEKEVRVFLRKIARQASDD